MKHPLSPAPLALVSVALSGALACSGTPQEPQTPAPSASVSAAPATSAAPSAAPSTSASAAEETPPAPKSSFVAVSTLPGPATLFPVDGAVVLAGDDTTEIKPEGLWGQRIGFIDGDRASFDDKLVLEGMHRIVSVSGTWPGSIDLLATGDTGRTGIAEHYQKSGNSFSAVSSKIGRYFIGPATVGTSLVAMEAPILFSPEASKVVTIRGPKVAFKLAPLDKKACPGMDPATDPGLQKSAVLPFALGATSDGTLLSYGMTCTEQLAVESWTASGKPSTITPLSGQKASGGRDEAQILTGTAKDAWLLAEGLFHYDGAAWKKQDDPPGGPASEGAVASDGTLWVIGAKGAVFALQKDTWRAEPLPGGAAANHVAVSKDGTVWITTANALLRSRRANDGDGVKVDPVNKDKPARKKHVSPGGPRCSSNVAVLYGFTKVTPDDYDFPLTRKALKGHKEFDKARFVVTKDAGQKFFTAIMPDYASGKKLVALIEKEVQGAKPALVCTEPEIVREVKIDLATGNVVK